MPQVSAVLAVLAASLAVREVVAALAQVAVVSGVLVRVA
jgi:hypothetical protein